MIVQTAFPCRVVPPSRVPRVSAIWEAVAVEIDPDDKSTRVLVLTNKGLVWFDSYRVVPAYAVKEAGEIVAALMRPEEGEE